MKVKNVKWNRVAIRAVVLAAALGCVSVTAQVLPPNASWQQGVSTTGQTVYFGPGHHVRTSAQNGQAIWESARATGGGYNTVSNANLQFGSKTVPVVAKGLVTGAAVVATFKAILGGPVGVFVTALTVLPALIDWLNVGHGRMSPSVPLGVEQDAAETATFWKSPHDAGPFNNPLSACKASYPTVTKAPVVSGTTHSCQNDAGNVFAQVYGLPTRFWETPPLYQPSTVDALKPDLEKLGVSKPLSDALNDAGGSLPISYAPNPVPVTGPVSISETPVVSTKTVGDITTKTTTTTKTDLTYGTGTNPVTNTSVPTVTGTTNTTIVTTTTNNSTGAVTTNNEITNNPAAPPPKPAEDPCKSNPDRVGCLDIDTPDGEIPKSTKTITYNEESVFGSGACPVNLQANIATLGKTVTVWDWQKTCDMATPLRALVLALATFAAFLIVMPGKVET